jgi:hypothetical protein
MCNSGGGGGGGNAAVQQAQQQYDETRAAEEARQARIRQGREQIDRLFDRGERRVVNRTQAENPEWTAWSQQPAEAGFVGNGTERFVGGGDGDSGSWVQDGAWQPGRGAEPARYTNAETASWESGGQAFDDAFYNRRRQNVLDYYTPQLNEQFTNAREQMAYALARAGLTRSSVASDQQTKMQRDYNIAAGDIANRAERDVNTLRGDVEDNRTELINQLNASADPEGAANSALARAGTLSTRPVQYDALGDIFAGATQGIGSFVQGARQRQTLDLMSNTFGTAAGRKPAASGSATVVR